MFLAKVTDTRVVEYSSAWFLRRLREWLWWESGAHFSEELRVRFEILEAYKGIDANDSLLVTRASSSMCGYSFEAGKQYLVYARRFPEGTLGTGLCSRTADAQEVKVTGELRSIREQYVDSLSLSEPAVIRPGHKALNTEWVPTGIDTFAVLTEHSGKRSKVGRQIVKTSLEKRNGTDLIIQKNTLDISGRDGNVRSRADSFALKRQSLAPVYAKSREKFTHNKEENWSMKIRFSKSNVQGYLKRNKEDTSINTTLEESYFYDESIEMVLTSLTLKEGYNASISTFDVDNQDESVLGLHVFGKQAIDRRSGSSCIGWKVGVRGRYSEEDGVPPRAAGVYWIGEEDRDLLRFRPRSHSMVFENQRGCEE